MIRKLVQSVSLTLAEEINDNTLGLEVIEVSINKQAMSVAWKNST